MSERDDWDEDRRAAPVVVGPRPAVSRRDRARRRAAARRRRTAGVLGLVLVAIVAVAAVIGGAKLWDSLVGSSGPVTDYTGSGVKDFVFEVHHGDTTKVIGQRLEQLGVVATAKAFTDPAQGNDAIAAIQPGFYKLRTHISGRDAVARLAKQDNRVGLLVVPEGRQLDDVAAVSNGAVTEGIFTLIAHASCVELNGQEHCVSASDLRQAAASASQAELSIPEWAAGGVDAVRDDHRRIEGLIAAGRWDFNPMAEPEQILSSLIGESSAQYEQAGLRSADAAGLSPYQVLVAASLIQRESKPRDFAKVARVVYNRLAAKHELEFDSTVNYPLDRQEVATTDDDRARVTLWNTYKMQGLPATPICSPSPEALEAAEHPEPGDWLYFVTIDAEGTTLFTADYQEHLANIKLAKDNGILDSAR